MIGRGLFKIDDRLRFSKLVDELSELCYTITYVSKGDYLLICFHKKNLDAVRSKFKLADLKVQKKGVLAFAKVYWREK